MDSDHALEVEQKLEEYLDIRDQPVKGAFGNVRNNEEKSLDLKDLNNNPNPEKVYRDNSNKEGNA